MLGTLAVILSLAANLPFTVDGKVVRATPQPLRLHQGEVLGFQARYAKITVRRLECAGDTHRIALTRHRWRVPDLPSGEYSIETPQFQVEVLVHSHSAPCP